MGRRGTKEQPTALKILRGNPGKRPLNADEPQYPDGFPKCPDWLGDVGRAKWQEVVSVLSQVPGLLKKSDGDMLAMYCEAFEEMTAAKETLETRGLIAISIKGGEYQHPAVGIKNRAIARMKQLGALFGMSPSDRAALKVPGGGQPKNKLSKYVS